MNFGWSLWRRSKKPVIGPALAAGAALLLCGCSGATIADNLPSAIGLPANAPQRTASPLDYPAVHDVPPSRPAPTLNDAEVKQMEADLATARDRRLPAGAGAAADNADKPAPAKSGATKSSATKSSTAKSSAAKPDKKKAGKTADAQAQASGSFEPRPATTSNETPIGFQKRP